MTISPELYKAIESGFYYLNNPNSKVDSFIIRFNGMPFTTAGKVRIFANKGTAKRAITNFVKSIFARGEFLQSYKDQVFKRTGYEIDFTESIKILPSSGKTDRFKDPKNVQMFVDIRNELINTQIITIERAS